MLRQLKFAENPLCELCEKKGLTIPAEDVHHIVSFMSTDDTEQRYHLAYDFGNLLSLCKVCHQKIHNTGHSKQHV
jgi:5-methylcytosine-specific restriction protein A